MASTFTIILSILISYFYEKLFNQLVLTIVLVTHIFINTYLVQTVYMSPLYQFNFCIVSVYVILKFLYNLYEQNTDEKLINLIKTKLKCIEKYYVGRKLTKFFCLN